MDRGSILRASTKLFAAALRGGRFSLLAWLIPYENGHVLGKQAFKFCGGVVGNGVQGGARGAVCGKVAPNDVSAGGRGLLGL